MPDGQALVDSGPLCLRAGDTVLLQGPSGSGKSSLFRALAGIWPYARLEWTPPQDFAETAMFLPQRPYFPNGRLRDALAYPQASEGFSDEALKQALREALLPGLVDRHDDEDAWGQKLSGGEQQRLAIARVLLKQPRWLFADEATSALDAAAEHELYARLREGLLARGGTLVSIAHRPSVAAFHQRHWVLTPQQQGARYLLQEAPVSALA